jgi:hypothetical protein
MQRRLKMKKLTYFLLFFSCFILIIPVHADDNSENLNYFLLDLKYHESLLEKLKVEELNAQISIVLNRKNIEKLKTDEVIIKKKIQDLKLKIQKLKEPNAEGEN